MAAEVPVTERINPLSVNIDVASPEEMVTILHKCDEEIFSGWGNYPGLADTDLQKKITEVSDIARDIMKLGSEGAIVFGGCGTSGRLGYITARTMNVKLESFKCQPCVHYIMAGGDMALFTSQESIEDDPIQGMNQLEKLCRNKTRVLYIGITCGLSAPFVAGQLEHCMENPEKYTPVLVGFNPAHLARNLKIEKWDKTFRQVVQRLETHKGGYILNPIVGPDPIAGSSRMKSGTATKMLLEMILMPALIKLTHSVNVSNAGLLSCYKSVCDSVYDQTTDIGGVVDLAGQSLKTGGHIYYLSRDTLGIMGMIDASECPPTYGATLDDVRGFVATGYDFLRNNEGDISKMGHHFRISLTDFQKEVAPSIRQDDLVIALTEDTPYLSFIDNLKCKKVCIIVACPNLKVRDDSLSQFDAVVKVSLPMPHLTIVLGQVVKEQFWSVFREIAVKWILNAITTGAHILLGKVYENIMVDLKVSNNKLFHRSVGIIKHFTKLSHEDSEICLLRSIYNTDVITPGVRERNIADHIAQAAGQSGVVPTAMMCALLKCSIADARQKLNACPVLRSAIQASVKQAKSN